MTVGFGARRQVFRSWKDIVLTVNLRPTRVRIRQDRK